MRPGIMLSMTFTCKRIGSVLTEIKADDTETQDVAL
jgi:hypothetical protein